MSDGGAFYVTIVRLLKQKDNLFSYAAQKIGRSMASGMVPDNYFAVNKIGLFLDAHTLDPFMPYNVSYEGINVHAASRMFRQPERVNIIRKGTAFFCR